MRFVQRETDSDAEPDDRRRCQDSVRAAGWSEEGLIDTMCICGFNNLMNRVVDATGIEGTDEEHHESGQRLATLGYDGTR